MRATHTTRRISQIQDDLKHCAPPDRHVATQIAMWPQDLTCIQKKNARNTYCAQSLDKRKITHLTSLQRLVMIILYIIFPFSTKVLDTVLKWLCPFIVYNVFFLTRLWYIIILPVYINTTRGTNFYQFMITLLFSKFYGFRVYFTTFIQS